MTENTVFCVRFVGLRLAQPQDGFVITMLSSTIAKSMAPSDNRLARMSARFITVNAVTKGRPDGGWRRRVAARAPRGGEGGGARSPFCRIRSSAPHAGA